jgi:endonuclease YncB( thermonuclease family)
VELQKRIEGKKIEIKPVGRSLDRYNRILGQVTVDGRDVGIELIEMGLATYYRPGCVDYPANKKSYDYDPRPYIAAEEKARAKKLYLWSQPKTVLPCKTRKTST